MPCYAMPSPAMPCHAMPFHAMSCPSMPCLLCHAMPFHTMPSMHCHAMHFHALPCHDMHSMPCHAMSFHAMPLHAVLPVVSCPSIPRHAIPRHAMPCFFAMTSNERPIHAMPGPLQAMLLAACIEHLKRSYTSPRNLCVSITLLYVTVCSNTNTLNHMVPA